MEFDNQFYFKVVVCEVVDDWISEVIGYSQLMNIEINVQFQFVMVGGGMEVMDQYEGVEGQLVYFEYCYYDYQYFYYLLMEY